MLLYILYTHDVICNLSWWNNGYNDTYKKRSIKAKTFWKKKILNKFKIIFHFLSLCVFISTKNIGRSILLSGNPTKWSNTLKQFVGNLALNGLEQRPFWLVIWYFFEQSVNPLYISRENLHLGTFFYFPRNFRVGGKWKFRTFYKKNHFSWKVKNESTYSNYMNIFQ